MDPRRVLTFRAVAHARSFSAAARRLGLSQPSVSNQVAALERETGVRLLERRPGALKLTPEGDILLGHADVIADRLELAGAQIAAAAHGRLTRLRIGALPTALAEFVPAAVARLRAGHPEVKVSFEEGAPDVLAGRVASGRLDLAIVYQDSTGSQHEPRGVERHHLLHERFLVALSPEHRLASRREIALTELRDEDWTAALTDGVIVRACRAAGFEPRLVSLTHDQLAIRGLISRGLAVTLAPELLVDPFRELALRPIAGAGVSRDVHALVPPGASHPLLARMLQALDAVAAELVAGRGSAVGAAGMAGPGPGRQAQQQP